MSARIADTVFNVIIRQIIIIPDIVKGKLENTHAGQIVAVPEGFHSRGDNAQIFSDNRQRTVESLENMVEKVGSRPFFPLAIDGGFFPVRNGPVGFKTAEMVDAEEICQG